MRYPDSGLWLQVDASRRRNDPHKRAKAPVSMVRLRGKSGRRYSVERGSSGERSLGANPPAGECGGKDQVSRKRRSNIQFAKGNNTSCTKTEHWFAGIAARNSRLPPANRNSMQETISKTIRSVARNAARHARTQRAVSSRVRCSTPYAQRAASRPRCRSSRETTSRSTAPSALRSAAADKNANESLRAV